MNKQLTAQLFRKASQFEHQNISIFATTKYETRGQNPENPGQTRRVGNPSIFGLT